MTVEVSQYINNLDINNPNSFTNPISEGAGHIRLIKKTIRNTFPSLTGEMSISSDQINLTFTNMTHAGTTISLPSKSLIAEPSTTEHAASTRSQMDTEFIRPNTSYAGDLVLDSSKGIRSASKSLLRFDGDWVTIGDPDVDTFIYGHIVSPSITVTQGGSGAEARPVGSIYENGLSNTNPATLLGYGVWQKYGEGRVLVGYKSNATHTPCRTMGTAFGANTHSLTTAETPAHTHSFTTYTWELYNTPRTGMTGQYAATTAYPATVNPAGSGSPHNNIMPCITVNRWIRIS